MLRWIFLLSFCVSCGPAKKIPDYKSAEVQLFDSHHEKNFSRLPTKGESSRKYWSNSLWTKERSLINWRWNSPESESSDYASPYQIEVFLMSQEELALLSPAEKFDLLMGRYDFPLKDEAYAQIETEFNSPYTNALSAIFHDEPNEKTLVNQDGISIPFGSSDIKALLAYHYGVNGRKSDDSIGKKCSEESCEGDLDAGTFHVTIANKLGISREAFFIDIDPKDKIEGRLAVGFTSAVTDEFRPKDKEPEGTVKVLKVLAQVTFLDTAPSPSWEPSGVFHQTRAMSYYLYLNLQKEVIGGKWLSSDRPDSLWIPGVKAEFSGFLEGLGALLEN